MAILEFTKEKPEETFRVTFEDDLPVAIEGPGRPADWKEMLKGDTRMNDYGWFVQAYYRDYVINEISDKVTKLEEVEEQGFEVAKLDIDKRLVFGWAYVTHDAAGNVMVDKSGEFVDDPEELERAAYDFVVKSRRAGDMHQQDVTVGTMVESMVLTPEKAHQMGIPPGATKTGWWVGFRIEDDTVWKAVKNGERPAFSIHGKARKEPT